MTQQIAEYSFRQGDRRQESLRTYIYTDAARRHHHGRDETRSTDWGFQYDDPKKTYQDGGFVNSPTRSRDWNSISRFTVLHRTRNEQRYMSEGLDAFKSGQVAMQMTSSRSFPALQRIITSAATRWLLRQSEAEVPLHQLGGQESRRLLLGHRDDALAYIKWLLSPTSEKVVGLAVFSCHKAVLNDPGFAKSAPFAADFLKSMVSSRTFWAEPAYASLLFLDRQKTRP